MLIVTIQSLTLPQAIGFALGSGGGYYLAVVLVAEGQRRLRNRRIPMSFRGLPITLLYLGMLALAHLRLYRPYPVDLTGRCGPPV